MAIELETFDFVTSHTGVGKKNTRDESFIKELNELCFEEEIKSEAFNIYKSMKLNIKRKDNRLGLKFFCIYNAYRNHGVTKDPNKIAQQVGLNNYNLTKIMKMFSFEQTGYRVKEININPIGYINDYYQQSGFRMDEIQNLYTFANFILEKNKLSEEYPQRVAAALIIYYISKIHNEKLPIKFFQYLGRDENNYHDIVNRIGSIYNN